MSMMTGSLRLYRSNRYQGGQGCDSTKQGHGNGNYGLNDQIAQTFQLTLALHERTARLTAWR